MNHEAPNLPSTPPSPSQSPETGGNQQRVPAYSAPGTTDPNVGFHFPDGDALHFSAGGSRSALRAESYARACRSRAAVLCANTDAEDGTLACAVYVASGGSDRKRSFREAVGKTSHDSDHYKCPCCECLAARKAADPS